MAKISKKEQKKEEIVNTSLKLFASKGYYNTTIPDIAAHMEMSVGNLYNYFKSKEELAKYIINYSSEELASKLREINMQSISMREKFQKFAHMYLSTAQESPELIDYFLRVFLSNREIFGDACAGFLCVNAFITEIMVLLEEGVKLKELREQDFFTAFATVVGTLGTFAFLSGEKILQKPLLEYADDLGDNMYRALKVD